MAGFVHILTQKVGFKQPSVK